MLKRSPRLAFNEVGSGSAIVFLHGFLESKKIWEDITPELPFRSICIDLPGHGDSKTDNLRSIEETANKIKELLTHLNVTQYSVVGHSMGGYVALELKKIDHGCMDIILLNSNFWTDSEQKKLDRLRTCDIVKKNKNLFIREVIPNLFCSNSQQVIESLTLDACSMDADAIIECTIAMMNRLDNTSIVKALKKDLAIIQGMDDSVMNVEVMRSKVENLETDYYEVQGGHMSWFEAREDVIEILSKKKRKL